MKPAYLVYDFDSKRPVRIVENGLPAEGESFIVIDLDEINLKDLTDSIIVDEQIVKKQNDNYNKIDVFEPPLMMYIELVEYEAGKTDLPIFEKFSSKTGMNFEEIAEMLKNKKKEMVELLKF